MFFPQTKTLTKIKFPAAGINSTAGNILYCFVTDYTATCVSVISVLPNVFGMLGIVIDFLGAVFHIVHIELHFLGVQN